MPGNRSRFLMPAILGLLLALSVDGATQAGYVVNVTEAGGDVIATGIGTIHTADLQFLFVGGDFISDVRASKSPVVLGPPLGSGRNVDIYGGSTGPSSFGTGGTFEADIGAGDLVGIINGNGLVLP